MKAEEKLIMKMINHTLKLYYKAEADRKITGNSFVELGDRALRVINPTTMVINTNTSKNKKIHGKSPVKTMEKKQK